MFAYRRNATSGLSRSRHLLFGASLAVLLAAPVTVLHAADEAQKEKATGSEALHTQSLEKTNPCFNGEGSIEEVLRACKVYIDAEEGTDKEHVIIAHGNRAYALSATGDMDGAIQELNDAIALDDERAVLYLSRARAYGVKKQYGKALADLEKTVELQPESAAPHILRGKIYELQDKQQDALDEYAAGLEKNAKYAPGYVNRGTLYRTMKDFDKAEADFTKVVELEPTKAQSYVDRGWVYVLLDELDKAEDDFEKALQIQDNNAFAIAGIGVVKSRKGKPTDGSADLSMARKLQPDIFEKIRALGVE